MLTVCEYFLGSSRLDFHVFTYYFALLLPAYFWMLTYFSQATSIHDTKDFYDEKHRSIWAFNLLAAYLSCIPPSATYFAEHLLINHLLHSAPGASFLVGLAYAVNGMVLFRVSTMLCRTRGKQIYSLR